MKPGMAILPAMRRASGQAASIAAHSAAARPSFHRIAGRSTSSRLSSSVAPCIWPASPMPATFAMAGPCSAARASSVAQQACHHISGPCSDQPGRGRETVSGALLDPTTD